MKQPKADVGQSSKKSVSVKVSQEFQKWEPLSHLTDCRNSPAWVLWGADFITKHINLQPPSSLSQSSEEHMEYTGDIY